MTSPVAVVVHPCINLGSGMSWSWVQVKADKSSIQVEERVVKGALWPPVIITEVELIATEQVYEGYPAIQGFEMGRLIHWRSGVNNSVLIAAPGPSQ